jgi:hypothetical protein
MSAISYAFNAPTPVRIHFGLSEDEFSRMVAELQGINRDHFEGIIAKYGFNKLAQTRVTNGLARYYYHKDGHFIWDDPDEKAHGRHFDWFRHQPKLLQDLRNKYPTLFQALPLDQHKQDTANKLIKKQLTEPRKKRINYFS